MISSPVWGKLKEGQLIQIKNFDGMSLLLTQEFINAIDAGQMGDRHQNCLPVRSMGVANTKHLWGMITYPTARIRIELNRWINRSQFSHSSIGCWDAEFTAERSHTLSFANQTF